MILTGPEIARATGGTLTGAGPTGPVLTDTRTLVPGSWFLALRGDRFDGHAFLDQAAAAGATGCVVSAPPAASWTGASVRVFDTTAALQDLGRSARDRLRCPVVGLTGSSGKTTTRALTALALSPLGAVHQTVGNLNNHLGVPMTLLAADPEADAAVVEMGTSSPGEIAALCTIARPTIRLIVNVGPAHLQELGGLDGVAREKGALFATAAPGDVLCVNVDDPRVRALRRPGGTSTITWGEHAYADVCLVDHQVSARELVTRARYRVRGRDVDAIIPAPGRHVALDGAGAIAVALAAEVDPAQAAAALSAYAPVGMRMRREEPLPGVVALNDAYNANPASMRASLEVLAAMPGRRVAVLGDMLELGPEEARFHADVVAYAAELGVDLIVLVGPRMRAAAASAGAVPCHALDHDAATALLSSWLRSGDQVLFKGSRGARVERVLAGLSGPSEAR